MNEKVNSVCDVVDYRRKFRKEPLLSEHIGFCTANENTINREFVIDSFEKFVYSLKVVDPMEVYYRMEVIGLVVYEVKPGIRG